MLEVSTQKNNFGTGCCFRSYNTETLTQNEFTAEMSEYNSTLTEADAQAAMNVLGRLFTKHVARGDRVELPFGTFHTVASGTCSTAEDFFKAGTGDNKIEVTFEIDGDVLAEIRKNARYKITSAEPVSDAKITEIIVTGKNGKKSEELKTTAGRPVRLKGHYLTFDIDDEKQGVFISDGVTESRIDDYYHRGTECIDFFVPSSLGAGEYQIKVVTKPRKDVYTPALATSMLTITA